MVDELADLEEPAEPDRVSEHFENQMIVTAGGGERRIRELSDEELHEALELSGVVLPIGRIYEFRGTGALPHEVMLAKAPPPSFEDIEAGLSAWAEWRADNGFDSDRASVVAAAQSATGTRTISAWGAPFTLEEEMLLIERTNARYARDPMLVAAEQTTGFGGFWSDLDTGAQHLAFTNDVNEDTIASVLAQYPEEYRSSVQVERVATSKKDLLAAKDQIVASAQDLDSRYGVFIVGVGLRIVENSVEVRVDPELSSGGLGLDALATELEEMTGVGVSVSLGSSGGDACTARNNCADPHRGGTRIESGSGGAYCSSGFVATTTGGNNDYVVSAGHCYDDTDEYRYNIEIGGYVHDFQDIALNSFGETEADAAIIGIEDSRRSNYVLQSSSDLAHPITAVENEGASTDQVGDPVCMSGATGPPWYDCGEILDTNDDMYYFDHWTYDLNRADYEREGGDSGGSVYYNYRAMGIHTGHSGADAMYSHIEEVEGELGVTIRTTK